MADHDRTSFVPTGVSCNISGFDDAVGALRKNGGTVTLGHKTYNIPQGFQSLPQEVLEAFKGLKDGDEATFKSHEKKFILRKGPDCLIS